MTLFFNPETAKRIRFVVPTYPTWTARGTRGNTSLSGASIVTDRLLGDLGNGRFVVLLGEVRHQVSQLREYDVAEA